MATPHLSNDEFFTHLASLIAKTQQKGHGSVFLTQKRLTHNSTRQEPQDPLHNLTPPEHPLPIIIRATDGKPHSKKASDEKKTKIGTIVQPEELETFFAKYAEVCKTGMQSLKKRDRSKRKKVKGKAAAAGKKEGVKT